MDTKEKKCKTKKNEMHVRVSRSIKRCRESIEKKPTSMDQEAIEYLSRRQKLSRWIEKLLRNYRDCNKKKLKSSIDSIAVERCRGAVERCRGAVEIA